MNKGSKCEDKLTEISGKWGKSSIESGENPSTFVSQRSYSNISSSSSEYCVVEKYREDPVCHPPSTVENTDIEHMKSILLQYGKEQVERYCKTFKEEMETKYVKKESVTQAQAAINKQ
ncbi:uncharacterized protein LOC133183573 [Saccostrea echinata]|uniref:uncharacterized protein LOC133183573 n=1 Tax=Saccostrea echinata TaxID=191078 RepID=UPI002A7F3773|nr:uncharacterized protein LOC133183573 [Saccostrea echinata]